ncbi:AsmA family protein [Gymnodinialimonas ceratoperidinii]|uniref:AsmA family protein n=1 Tax=Gymnodinialimonas ceratoperidinii TaxID=2856823 RepID=A0A8F6Y9U1_9RHOB|nr:AsmA-like C-terminal region-containing protein [Gymnodinialimonas ceratoperidinii]QXT39294.1 AsmA family protein [Gymnodinialimonas ceratoperidinii]
MRWIIRVLAAIVVLLFLGLGTVLLIPAERIAEIAGNRISAATGRPVTITGEARPTLWPDLGVEIDGLQVANPSWAGSAPLISADKVNVGVAWSGLLSGNIHVNRAVFEGASITLVRAEDGSLSWEADEEASVGEPRAARRFGLEEAIIRDAQVRFEDREAGTDLSVTALNATLRLPDSDGAGMVSGTAQVNGVPMELETTIDGVAGLIAGEARPMQARLVWPEGRLAFDGTFGVDAAAAGRVELSAQDLSPLAALAGQDLPELPEGFGRDHVALAGEVRRAREGSLHLRDATLQLDETILQVAADLVPGEVRPMLRGTITGGEVSLPSALSGDALTEAGWSQEILDVSGLFNSDADLTVRVESLALGGLVLGEVDLRATVERGRLVFDIASIRAYEGQLAGQFVVNGRGGLSVGGDLILFDAALRPFLGAVAGYERLEGRGSASVEFLGVGDDLHTLMSGLEAEGDIAIGQGALLGLNLASLLDEPEATDAEGRTLFDRLTADFIVRDGVLMNEDLLLDAPWGEVRGAGEIDLGATTLDYTLAPAILRDAGRPAQAQIPIALTGTWAAPEVGPDLELLAEIERAAEAERRAAEARAAAEEEAELFPDLGTATDATPEPALEPAREESEPVVAFPEDIEQQLTDELISGVQELIFGDLGEVE